VLKDDGQRHAVQVRLGAQRASVASAGSSRKEPRVSSAGVPASAGPEHSA
jgi:hypothetical protein